MVTALPRLPDITAADLRAINRLTGQLVDAPDLDTLGRELIGGSGKILPADFMVWNLWTPAMDELLSFEANHKQLRDAMDQREDSLLATIHHHPVIAAGQLERTRLMPQRMSDYQSSAAFKSNPLFQEVYRHLDSNYQIAYNAILLGESQIILSWNLRNRDFTDREVQLLHLLGLQVATLGRRIEERRHLREMWETLNRGLGAVRASGATPAPTLGANDGRILSALIQGAARTDIATSLQWRRDTLDRHLSSLRERLGYDSTGQLMQALATLKPSPAHTAMIR